MASKIEKILFATDLSPSARHAFEYVCRMAGPLGASIIILHVMGYEAPNILESAAGGSAALKVIKRSRIPVLLVPPHEGT